jgi:4a-hydroxytetrahydrobiopterin dehydratase
MSILTHFQIIDALKSLPGWAIENEKLRKEFQFGSFKEAMVFVNTVADNAERVNHHPDILISYTTVALELFTHDAGGITQKDIDFARGA